MSLLAPGLFDRDAQEQYARLLQNQPLPVSKNVLNTTFRFLGFRLVAGISAAVHFYITRPHRNAPFSLFKLILEPNKETAATILAIPAC